LNRAVVLMYHQLSSVDAATDPSAAVYNVPVDAFARQMDLLAGNAVVPFARAVAEPLPERAVVLTFDDGHATDHAVALPELVRRGFEGTFFVTPAWIGTRGYMGWPEVRALLVGGMTVGAHGFDHSPLGSLKEDALRTHLREARRLMEDRLGRAPDFLSLPGGSGSELVLAVARELGFRAVAGSVPRLASPGSRQPLPRFAIRRADSEHGFRALVEQQPLALASHWLRHQILTSLRLALGEQVYQAARRTWSKSYAGQPSPPPGPGAHR